MMVLEIIGAAAAVITIFSAGVLQRLSFRKPESIFLAIKKTAHSPEKTRRSFMIYNNSKG